MSAADYYDEEFYEDDFTDEEEDYTQERGSSQGQIDKLDNRNVQNFKPNKAVQQKPTNSKTGPLFTKRGGVNSSMARKGEVRVRSSKRRAHNLLRNQLAELSISHDELLRENKLLKQIQKRQEKELNRYTNAEEDIPRLLDANSFEIAGLKQKNKQLLFERRENDDKLRRQHQEIMTLKDSNKKITDLANNKKLGEREQLTIDLTTARVTIAHQENRIQDLTKAVEIYKKNADRECKGNLQQLKKVQNNLRDLQDAYNDLFIKYKAKERESGDHNIYAQKIRRLKRAPSLKVLRKSQTDLVVESVNSTAQPSPRRPKHTSSEQNISSIQDSDFEVLESELEAQTQSLVNLQEEITTPRAQSPAKMRPKSSSTLGDSDSEPEIEESDAPVEEEASIVEENTQTMIPSPAKKSEVHIISAEVQKKEAKSAKPSVDVLGEDNSAEEKRRAREELEEKERQAEALALEKLEEEMRRIEAKRLRDEEEVRRRIKATEMKEAQEEEERRRKEAELLAEKKAKDDALKNKLAAMRKQGGGDDFMSQLKANSKKNTPVTSPEAVETVEQPLNKQGSGDNFRKNAVLNNAARLTPKKPEKKPEEEFTGYQPSFAGRRAPKKEPASPAAPVEEYTPSFSNSQRISQSREKLNNSREKLNDGRGWTPVGKASSQGLFEDKHKPLLSRRSSSKRNVLPTASDDDLEEFML